MTFPPPPPDRTHLQYQPAPVPQQPPPQMGPGGAYGPMQQSSDQPIPGQLPAAGMMMTKPGTVTGIQVILWIFVALGAIANLFSIISMVDFFHPLQLLVLAYAVYSTIQSLVSPVQIARGKRWAWIWSLVNAILGLLTAIAALVFGILYFDNGGEISLLIGAVLTGLYGTLLGLLCSKSARQWIIMHRIQRGEVPMPGAVGGLGPAGMAQGHPAAPERPATRPGSATFTAVAMGLLAALSAWGVYAIAESIQAEREWFAGSDWADQSFTEMLFRGTFERMLAVPMGIFLFTFLAAAVTAPLILKGKLGGRVFGFIWSILLILASAYLIWALVDAYQTWAQFYRLPGMNNPFYLRVFREIAFAALTLLVFVLLMTPGVRAWTPGNPSSAAIVMVPMGQPQQTGPYGQAPQTGPYGQQAGPYGPPQPPRQQSPYPPQY